MQHVVAPAKGASAFDGQDVECFFHHAQPAFVAFGIQADGTARPGADVEAEIAEDDLVAHGDERRGERRASPSCARSR